jgi:hypothetical protein
MSRPVPGREPGKRATQLLGSAYFRNKLAKHDPGDKAKGRWLPDSNIVSLKWQEPYLCRLIDQGGLG